MYYGYFKSRTIINKGRKMAAGINLKVRLVIIILLLGMTYADVAGRTIYVDDEGPADFNNIQAAIDDANDGDTILVRNGTYTGNGNSDIDFKGKAITLRSEKGPENCILNCQKTGLDWHGGFNFHNGEEANSIIDGFTITNADTAGISCRASSPTIYNCIVFNSFRGGIYLGDNSCPTLSKCIITNNMGSHGGGINCSNSNPIIDNCLIVGNEGWDVAGGIYCRNGNIRITNCTISNNINGGICFRNTRAKITKCILWGSSSGQIIDWYNDSVISVSYSDIEDGWPGEGNIDADPCFADTNNDDYHLRSQAGRWDANEGRWTTDEVTSTCIDAGDPMSPVGLEPFPNGGIINMGAYGGTVEASKSYFGQPVCEIIVAGDINGDCKVNFLDFRLMSLHWLRDENP